MPDKPWPDPNRVRARELAAEYQEKGDPGGWFEALYREASEGKSTVPWADLAPNPNLLEFWKQGKIRAEGKRALKIGCGLGHDAEQHRWWGFATTAFDISESAIRQCKQRFPESAVEYAVADLLSPPRGWFGRSDFVLESYTLQVLPAAMRPQAIACAAGFVKAGGHLLLIARGRVEGEPEGQMPWPLLRVELDAFAGAGLREISSEEFFDSESPPVRRFRVLYQRG